MKFFLVAASTCVFAMAALGQQSADDRRANTPVEPFNIIGNIYYVGAAEVTSFLITTRKGHILIDAGFPETAEQIIANVKKLGFKTEDIEIMLNTQAHFDHAGGFPALKRATGAKLIASAADKPLMERGGKGDFAFGDTLTYEPIVPDAVLKDGSKISLGGVSLTPVAMPGHTKGATAYLYDVKVGVRRYQVLFFSSVSTPGFNLVNSPGYPELVTDLEKTFTRVKPLKPDVFLASHGSFFDLLDKAEIRRKGGPKNPFIDSTEFPKFLDESEKAFRKKLGEQREKASAKKE